MSDSPRNVIERFIDEVANSGNFANFDELVSEEIVSNDPAEPGPIVGREAYRAGIEATRAALADLRVRIEDCLVEGNKAAYR